MEAQKRTLLIAVVFFWLAQYVYIPYQTPYLTLCGLSAQAVGLVVGAYGISQMLLRLPVGVAADLGGTHRKQVIGGCVASGLASLIRMIWSDGAGFFAANLFSGFASAMWISFMTLYMSYYKKEEQQLAASHLILCNNLGILLGFGAATVLYQHIGMRMICAISVASGLLAGGFACRLRESRREGAAVSVPSLLAVCANRRLILFSLLALIQQGIQMATTMSFTLQIIRGLGASELLVGLSSIIYMVSAVGWSRFASTALCAKVGPRRWIPAVFLLLALYCQQVPVAASVGYLCLLQILPGLATGILYTYLTSEAMAEIPPEKKSTAMGFYQAVYALGMTVFPVLCGRLSQSYSMPAAYGTLSLIAVAGAVGAVGGMYALRRSARDGADR